MAGSNSAVLFSAVLFAFGGGTVAGNAVASLAGAVAAADPANDVAAGVMLGVGTDAATTVVPVVNESCSAASWLVTLKAAGWRASCIGFGALATVVWVAGAWVAAAWVAGAGIVDAWIVGAWTAGVKTAAVLFEISAEAAMVGSGASSSGGSIGFGGGVNAGAFCGTG